MPDKLYVFDNIPFHADISALESNRFFTGDIRDECVAAAWAEASRIVRPKAIIACVDVLHNSDGKVVSVGGQTVSSVVLDTNLATLHRAFAYVATCGTEVTAIDCGNNIDIQTALFAFRILALRAARSYVAGKMQDYFGVKKLATVNPGSLPEWPLSEQTTLFAMLGRDKVKDSTGVTLGTNMFMTPMESSSGLMFETEKDYQNCMLCTRKDCIGRRAKYDEELAKKYR